jgi:hypothetical protein
MVDGEHACPSRLKFRVLWCPVNAVPEMSSGFENEETRPYSMSISCGSESREVLVGTGLYRLLFKTTVSEALETVMGCVTLGHEFMYLSGLGLG